MTAGSCGSASNMPVSTREVAFEAASREEYTVAVGDIRKYGWRRALQASQDRLDAELAEAEADAVEKPACRSGCWFCCYLKVGVRAEEAFSIVDFVRNRFTRERSQETRRAIAANARIMRRATPADQLTARLKCAFLIDGACSIYEVRPARCRTHHAVEVERCQVLFEQPGNLNILTSYVPRIFTAGEAHRGGYDAAARDSGFDTTIYEMSTALDECLTDSRPLRRFESGRRAFSRAVPGDT